jgi:hypothetical protein
MQSPHGQPSPALVRSIHQPYSRHNVAKTGGGLMAKRPEKPAASAFPQLSRDKTVSSPIPARPHHALVIRLLDLTRI